MMSKALLNSCFPIIRRRQGIVTLVFFEQGSTKTLCGFKKHVAGEIMFEFPDQIVCHADSFFIGRQVPALAMDDYLIPGQTYFVLPIERFAYKILTTSCLSIFNSNNLENVRSTSTTAPPLNFTAPSSPPPFEYSKGPNGKILIKVSPSFILNLMCRNRTNIEEEAITCGESSSICNSPELKKQYEQLVGTREHMWSPNLQTISEHKMRVSPLQFFGLNRKQEKVI
ncbi:hypothetical protein CARUB_v10003684mg [Capsella rubella]|uniref:DUF4228 domain-containing protein n=1 Tax=Capsella rubella TaxID=81985 RepID=R0HGM3_9BRAS|nr:uncharacterized protein LOC17883492 [Capsella rubella]EOA22948.1 hypothetical protein CARUB_v10003684mg [Capsella rubella]